MGRATVAARKAAAQGELERDVAAIDSGPDPNLTKYSDLPDTADPQQGNGWPARRCLKLRIRRSIILRGGGQITPHLPRPMGGAARADAPKRALRREALPQQFPHCITLVPHDQDRSASALYKLREIAGEAGGAVRPGARGGRRERAFSPDVSAVERRGPSQAPAHYTPSIFALCEQRGACVSPLSNPPIVQETRPAASRGGSLQRGLISP